MWQTALFQLLLCSYRMRQKDLVKRLLEEKGRTIEQYALDSLETLTTAQASNLITNLMQLPKVEKNPEPKKEFDDDLPF